MSIKRHYETKRIYNTKSRKVSKVKSYILLGAVMFSAGLIFGDKLYTEYQIESLVIPVQAAEHKEIKIEVKPNVVDYAWQQAEKAGLNPLEIVAIINCESGFSSTTLNGNKNGSVDVGIAQWNLRANPDVSLSDALNPYKSIDLMIQRRLKDKSWHAWICARILKISK